MNYIPIKANILGMSLSLILPSTRAVAFCTGMAVCFIALPVLKWAVRRYVKLPTRYVIVDEAPIRRRGYNEFQNGR